MCRKHNLILTEEEFTHKVFGRTEVDTLNFLFKNSLTPDILNQLLDERVKIAMELFKPDIAMTPGLADFLEDLSNNSIPTAIATSARWPYTNFVLDTLQIRDYFQAIVTAEDIQKGKPDPEIYLRAAKHLSVEPNYCWAIEDSVSGIKSAKAAGMEVIGITTTHPKAELKQADKIVESFKELNVRELF